MSKPHSSLKEYRRALRETAGYDIAPYIHKNRRGLEYLDFSGFVNEVYETVLSDTETHGCNEDMSKKDCALSHLNEEVPEFCLFGSKPCVKTEVKKRIESEYANEERYSEDYGSREEEDEYFRSRMQETEYVPETEDPAGISEKASVPFPSCSRMSDEALAFIMRELREKRAVKGLSRTAFDQILKKHSQNPIMRQARAISVNGTKFVIVVSSSGMDHTFDTKKAFESFVRGFDKAAGRTVKKRKTVKTVKTRASVSKRNWPKKKTTAKKRRR